MEKIRRLSLFFDTPNELATALVMLWGALVCLHSFRSHPTADADESKLATAVRNTGGTVAAVILVACLMATYSRSGMVALLGIGGLFCGIKRARALLLVSLATCIICLLLFPGASERFTTIEPFADKSIANRLDVWRGTLAMSLGSPWTGHGIFRFGEMLTTWHLPLNGSDAVYMTAVNTPLTVLGFWGYPALFIYLWGWLLLLIAGFSGFCKGMREMAVCFIIQLSFITGGFFADLHQSWILDGILLASICGTVTLHLKGARPGWLFCRRWGVVSAAASAAACGLAVAAGMFCSSGDYSLHGVPLVAQGRPAGRGWILTPQKPNGKRLIWVVSHDMARVCARSLCRPLARRGWEVFILEATAGDILNPDACADFLQTPPFFSTKTRARIVGGMGEEGLVALALASKLPEKGECPHGTVAVDIESYWPFDKLNPQNTIKALAGRVILAHGNAGTRYAHAAGTLAELGREAGRRVDVLPVDASRREAILAALGAWLTECRHPCNNTHVYDKRD